MRDIAPVRADILRKAEQLVQAPYGSDIHHADTKLWHFLLSRVYADLRHTKFHRVQVSEVLDFLGHHSRARLHESLQRLNDAEIKVEWTDADGVPHSLRAHYLSYDIAHCQDGIITFAFDPFALELLQNPKVYAQLSMQSLRSFRSVYSTKLYEMMALRERRDHRIWEVSLEEFREIMGISPDEHDRFNNLNRRVIVPALEEVNEIAPFGVILTYVGGGRGGKVRSLKFEVVPRDRRSLMDALPTPDAKSLRGRPGNVPDLFTGQTDEERMTQLSPNARARAMDMLAHQEDRLNEEFENWKKDMRGRRVVSVDKSFLGWLDLKLARLRGQSELFTESEDPLEVDQDAINSFLSQWEGKL